MSFPSKRLTTTLKWRVWHAHPLFRSLKLVILTVKKHIKLLEIPLLH